MRKNFVFLLIFFLVFPLVFGFNSNEVIAATEFNRNSSNLEIETKKLPGDFSNNCKIIKTFKGNNVKLNKSSDIITRTTLGIIGALIPYKRLYNKIISGAIGANLKIPKNKNLWTTTQVRECKDSLGYHRTLIIKYYSNSKRTKSMGIEYVKVN